MGLAGIVSERPWLSSFSVAAMLLVELTCFLFSSSFIAFLRRELFTNVRLKVVFF